MIKVKFKFNGTKKWWYNYKSRIKIFNNEDDIFVYITNYNTHCTVNEYQQDRGTIVDFEVL